MFKDIGIVIGILVIMITIIVYIMRKNIEKIRYKAVHIEPIQTREMGFYEKYIKRVIDVTCAVMAIICLSPLYLVIAMLVWIKLGSPILFTQNRPGLITEDGRETIFKMYKFRTMTNERDENGDFLPDEMRLTKFGVWLRRTSLDELPEVFNILNNTLSLVGPRPQLVRDLTFMTKEQRMRHTAKPGLSGLAQINGRNAISWEEKLNWDLKYIQKVSFVEDIQIILKTVMTALIKQEGITEENMATTEDLGDYLLRSKKIDSEFYLKKQKEAKMIIEDRDELKKTIALLNCHEDDVICFRKEIIEALIDRGYNVVISCPEGRRLNELRNISNIRIENIRIDRRGTNPIHDLKLLFDYIAFMKKYNPDVVCTFTIKPNIYGSIAADICGIPHINNITGLGSGFINGGRVQKIVQILYRIALRNSRKVFFQNNENMKTAIDSKMISKNSLYECIPGSGVNLERFHYVEKEKNDYITFNYIGRVLKEKGIDDYINVANIIKQRYPNVLFNVIGFVEPTEIYYKQILKKLEEKGIIHYCGSVDDVRPYIINSDAIIHPSSYGEGISNVLLETAASGRVIITTNISGCREVVDDGKSGFVYQAKNIHELEKKIEKFIALTPTERKSMGKVGRKKVEKEFNRQVVVESYIRSIEKCI